MGHHGPDPFDEKERKAFETFKSRNEQLRELLDVTGFVGALGTHPEGKLTEGDQGAIQFAIGSKGDKVVLDFGTSVHWVGMSAKQAADLASSLLRAAREVGRRTGETVTLTIGK